MSTRSRARSARSTPRPPLVGRLHEIAIARPVAAPPATQGSWQRPPLAGQVQNPQMVVVGQLGRGNSAEPRPLVGKSALARWLYFDALCLTGRQVVVLDEAASVEPFDFSSAPDKRIDPLSFGHALSSSSGDTAGEW